MSGLRVDENRAIPDAECALVYERQGDLLRLKLRGMTNHEVRQIIVGLWLRLTPADRAGTIAELRHYLQPGSSPSPVARAIATGKDLDDR